MMAIRALTSDDETREIEEGEFINGVYAKCFEAVSHARDPDVRVAMLAQARQNLCQGEMLLAAAGLGEPPTLEISVPAEAGFRRVQATVLPQSNATNLRLMRASMPYLAGAIRHTGALLSGAGMHVTDEPESMTWQGATRTALLARGDGGTSYAFGAASVFRNAYKRGADAFRAISKLSLALSDADRSSTSSFSLGNERAVHWRTLGATLMVGNSGQFATPQALPSKGFCSTPELSAQSKLALSIFRQAAVYPEDLLMAKEFEPQGPELPIERLVDAKGSSGGIRLVSGGSVRERLEEYWGIPIPSVAEHYGLDYADFAQARTYLAQEIRAFSRSTSAKLGKLPLLSGGRSLTFSQYSATATPPPARGAEYYTALARTVPNQHVSALAQHYPGETDFMDEYPGLTSYSHGKGFLGNDITFTRFTDFAYAWAKKVVVEFDERFAGLSALQQVEYREQVVGPLADLLSQEDSLGTFEFCWDHYGPVAKFLPMEGGWIVVRGEAGLECAQTGFIEGEPCNLDDPQHVIARIHQAYETNVEMPPDFFEVDAADILRWYLMKPNPGTIQTGAGNYQPVMGFAPQANPGTACRTLPIVPEAFELAGKLLAPNRAFCAVPETSCDGSTYDARLPLEDELTNDGDDAESSWKHYLGLARQAANESDLFGKEYVESGLAVDQEVGRLEDQAAAQLDRLQSICGTAVDAREVLAALSHASNDELDNVDLGRCPDVGPGTGQVCVANRLLRDPLAIAENLPGLDECVGRFEETIDFVHLGDASLCLWRNLETKGICDTKGINVDGLEHKCPSILEMDDTNNDGVPDTVRDSDGVGGVDSCADADRCPECTGARKAEPLPAIAPQDTLKFFPTAANLPVPRDRSLCDDIRRLRRPSTHEPERSSLFNKLKSTDIFNLSHLSRLRERIRFEALYGGAVAVWVDGVRRYVTSLAPPMPQHVDWPCGSLGVPAMCGPNEPSLFCNKQGCSDVMRLAWMNERLLRAVWAAQYTTWRGNLGGTVRLSPDDPAIPLTLPYYLPVGASLVNPTSHDAFIASGGGATPQGLAIEVQKNALWTHFSTTNAFVPLQHPGAFAHTLGAPASQGFRWELFDQRFGWFALLKYTPARVRPAVLPFREAAQEVRPRPEEFWAGMSSDRTLPFAGPSEDERLPGVVALMLSGQALPSGFKFPGQNSFDQNIMLAPDYRRWAGGPVQRFEDFRDWHGAPGDDHIEGIEGPNLGVNKYAHGLVDYEVSPEALLDGMELLCEVNAAEAEENCTQKQPPAFESLADLGAMSAYLRCAGDEIKRRAGTAVFAEFPKSAMDPLRKLSVGPYETVGGELGSAVSQLRQALMQVASSGPELGGTVRRFGEDLRSLQHAIAINGIEAELNQVEFEAKQFANAADCVSSIIKDVATVSVSVATSTPLGPAAGLGMLGTALGCLQGFAQIGFLEKIRDLGEAKSAEELALIISQYSQRFSDHATALEKQSLALADALEEVNRQLGAIETLRTTARRALNESIWTMSRLNQGPVTEVMRQRNETARIRYERAFDSAKQMANLAKRSIEQRLGMRLSELREDLPLIAAPQSWEGTLCATSGIDYDALRDPDDDKPNNFADAFIGDYVTKLENVVEAYRLRYNFHEGSDIAVVSVRDDIHNVRSTCARESKNLFFHSGDLDRAIEGRPGWTMRGNESVPRVPPSQDLVGWWPLDANAEDASPAGLDMSGTFVPIAGKVGGAMRFDGITNCLTRTPSGVTIRGAPGITMMAWVNSNEVQGGRGDIFSRDFDFSMRVTWTSVDPTPWFAGIVRVANFGPAFTTMPALTNGTWTHRAVTWGSDGTVRVFTNGQLVSNVTQAASSTPFWDSGSALAIGCSVYGTVPSEHFAGAIDEVSLHRRALTPDEISAYYAATSGGVEPQPVEITAGGVCSPELTNCSADSVSVATGLETTNLPIHTVKIHSDAGGPINGLVQRIWLERGSYRFSWHAPTGSSDTIYAALRALDPVISFYDVPRQALPEIGEDDAGRPWLREYITFEIDHDQEVDVGWVGYEDYDIDLYLELAGAMLERIDSNEDALPVQYEATTDVRETLRVGCEDTSGANFRQNHWSYQCINLCPDGFSSDCSGRVQEHCYYETSFHLSQRGIEAGQMLNHAGFARGNFNYRIHSLGLNFVGPGVRDCSESDLPTTCHGAGYVPYSLIHEGPYVVRNHEGDDFRANLFRGHIEHARGLGTERYLTNPLGSADSELLSQYLRSELKGRPLDGTFILRVWDEPGVNFHAIQDVQLVLNYGYWTRFD